MNPTDALAGGPAQGLVSDASGKNEELAANGRKLALAVYVMLKSALLYDVNNRFWERPLSMFDDVVRWHFGDGVGKPLALASVEKALFLNGTLVRLDAGSYGAMRFVSRAFDQMGLEEMAFLGPVSGDDLRPLVNVVRDAIRARSGEPLLDAVIPGVRFRRKVERQRDDEESTRVDPRVAAVQAYATSAATCAEFRSLFLGGGNPSLVRLKRAAQELVTAVLKHADLMVGLTQLPRLRGTAAGHMTNCATFSLLIARKLELPRRSYGELALNAMLAPLGIAARENQAVEARDGASGPDAVARMSAAVAMMKRYGALARPALVRSAIVHERSDAHGREYRLGMKPHLFSRVIAAAAAYDLANQDALPDEALRRIVAQSRGGALDADVVALLSEALGLYPVGSTVKLSDGTTGVVVQAPQDPTRRAFPVVRVLQGTGGRLVDLGQAGGRLSITGTLAPETQQINVAHCFLL